jgi:hypothetical protein
VQVSSCGQRRLESSTFLGRYRRCRGLLAESVLVKNGSILVEKIQKTNLVAYLFGLSFLFRRDEFVASYHLCFLRTPSGPGWRNLLAPAVSKSLSGVPTMGSTLRRGGLAAKRSMYSVWLPESKRLTG